MWVPRLPDGCWGTCVCGVLLTMCESSYFVFSHVFLACLWRVILIGLMLQVVWRVRLLVYLSEFMMNIKSIGYYHKIIYQVSMIPCSQFFLQVFFFLHVSILWIISDYKMMTFLLIPEKASWLKYFLDWLGSLQKLFTVSNLFTGISYI